MPVVLVPGLGLDRREWRTVRPLLGAQSTVLPLPALGRGAPRGTDLSVEAQADRVLRLLPAGRPVLLVGHSASSPVVVEVARRAAQAGPDGRGPHVVGLVLVGPITDPRAGTWPRILARWARSARYERFWEMPVLAPQYASTGALSMVRGLDVVRRYRTDLGLVPDGVPVEVVRGEHDRIAPLDWCTVLAGGVEAQVTTVPGVGHMVPLAAPASVAAAVDRVRARAAVPADRPVC